VNEQIVTGTALVQPPVTLKTRDDFSGVRFHT
jgi:hypothetical protein